MKPVRQQTEAELTFNRRDLNEVISIQEAGQRDHGMHTPKLGAYWDELHAVLAEINRRRTGSAHA